MPITNALASVAVTDLARSMTWYQKLFGRQADSRPMPELAEWKFEGGGWLQVYQLEARAGAGSVTLVVSSLEDQIEHLHEVGIDSGKTIMNEQAKVVMIKDPDGNSIAFAQPIDPSGRH